MKKKLLLSSVFFILISIKRNIRNRNIRNRNIRNNNLLLSNLKKNNELVVSVYNENIDWISNEINNYTKITIYSKNFDRFDNLKNKWTNKTINVINFPNIGSCDHVFMYHIIYNYNNLKKIIHFSKGTKNDKRLSKKNVYLLNNRKKALTEKQKKKIKSFHLDKYLFKNHKDLNFKFHKSKYNNLEEYLISLFGKNFTKHLFKYSNYIIFKGYFIVSRKNIHRYDKKIYEKLINYENKNPNREIDHFHERIWGLLFSNTQLNSYNKKKIFKNIFS